MGIGLKNSLGLVKDLAKYYDFAMNEECIAYKECQELKPFSDQQKAIFSTEYKGVKATICATGKAHKMMSKYNFGNGWNNCFNGVTTLPQTEYTSPQENPPGLSVENNGIVRFKTGYTWTNNAWGDKNGIDSTKGMKVVDVDLFDVTQERINLLRKAGHIVVCYISVGTIEVRYLIINNMD